ncbi:hypothetical protein R1flu_021348 [Riccia fluitans]|uniref:Uncharacterized protein n=1 Tax=Riccia fluitans TaxID=41844 RepID=A0ABD1ZP34_9MARC
MDANGVATCLNKERPRPEAELVVVKLTDVGMARGQNHQRTAVSEPGNGQARLGEMMRGTYEEDREPKRANTKERNLTQWRSQQTPVRANH